MIEYEVFIGQEVTFVNDTRLCTMAEDGSLQTEADSERVSAVMERGTSIGSGLVILGGVRVDAGSLLGPGPVVAPVATLSRTVTRVPARLLAQQAAP